MFPTAVYKRTQGSSSSVMNFKNMMCVQGHLIWGLTSGVYLFIYLFILLSAIGRYSFLKE